MHSISSQRSVRRPALSRRDFIGRLGSSGLACAILGPKALGAEHSKTAVKPVVGSQLYGWGQYYQRDGKDMGSHMDEVLSAIRDAGYDYAEGTLDTNQPENNAKFAESLKSKGMKPVSLYTGGRLHEPDKTAPIVEKLIAAARVARDAGFSVINCNPDSIGRDKTDEELLAQAAALTDLGKGLGLLGLRLGIHHHTPEMRNQGREFHSNFKHGPAGVVDFCYDVHWVYRGGIAPSDALNQYSDRVVSWHLRQSREGIWWEDLAPGDIDYAAVAKFAGDHGLPPRYTVELALETGTKITRTVVENHRRSREFVRQIFAC